MNRRTRFAAALFVACTAPAFAQEGATTLSPIAVTPFVADCTFARLPTQGQFARLPTQGQVAEWTGLHNLGQVYAARGRLMASISSACQRRGVARVQVVTRSLSQGEPWTVAEVQHLR